MCSLGPVFRVPLALGSEPGNADIGNWDQAPTGVVDANEGPAWYEGRWRGSRSAGITRQGIDIVTSVPRDGVQMEKLRRDCRERRES